MLTDMSISYGQGVVNELEQVQPEIRNNFWHNTQSFLRNEFEIVNEEKYSLTEDKDTEVSIDGKADHAIQVFDSNLSSAALEDKQNWLKMSEKDVSKVVTEVKFQVDRMVDHINYAPAEYVGLLQNGLAWIAVPRKIVGGKVFWTHVRTAPDSNGLTCKHSRQVMCAKSSWNLKWPTNRFQTNNFLYHNMLKRKHTVQSTCSIEAGPTTFLESE